MQRYNPSVIEPKWQKVWSDTNLFSTPINPGTNKYYCLVMFPYPSGNLHIGHWYNFAPADTVARYHKMTGKKLLNPIGFDAFGLPAENAAISNKTAPAKWTRMNIEKMLEQLSNIGPMYDMSKTVNTSAPEYYKWTQWIFLKLYENGLAYQRKGTVNWCPKDQTVLANEQVVGDKALCDRCDTPVIQKELKQWYFKITDYAEQLLDDLNALDWPERVKTMQQNWIGKSVGAQVSFKVDGAKDRLDVFTTRPDTLFGATYMVLAPEHKLVKQITTKDQEPAVAKYVEHTSKMTELDRKEAEKEKTGEFTGAYAINPVNNAKIPIWISDYVLMSYGTGAIMAVPAHDQRDWEFAKQFDLPIIEVIKTDEDVKISATPGEGEVINSGKYNGKRSAEVRELIVKDLATDKLAYEQVNYRIRDWLISRQRYWGPPIPIVHCKKCGEVPIPYDQLPVKLPEDVEFEPTGQSPLLKIDDFVNAKCPKCEGPAKRETDTMDTFVDSSWYYLRYPNPNYEDGPFDPEAVKTWLPVDHYIGGIEHAILHLLYSRFITKALHDHADLPISEPFKKLTNQGIILGNDGYKMSKSKGNVVDPDDQVGSYGADSLRLYLMFMGPYDQGGPYDLGGIAGTRRFLDRVWTLVADYIEVIDSSKDVISDNNAELETQLLSSLNRTIKKVTHDLENLSFNTAIAAMMEFTNSANKILPALPYESAVEVWRDSLEILLRLLAPFAPHMSEELWRGLGQDTSIHTQQWPAWNEDMLSEELMTIVVQINGKVRTNLLIATGTDMEEAVSIAQKEPNISKYLSQGELIKTIKVPNKLINFVVK